LKIKRPGSLPRGKPARNRRWCSDGFQIGCDNGEKVRVVFALDCCDREAMSLLATPAGIDVRVLMVAAIEHRFGMAHRLQVTIEWLSDNDSCYVASDTRSFARDISLEPRTTPIESPQSNGNGRSLRAHHLNEIHPHKALGYHSPREFISARGSP
jgi:putative transposase